MHQYIVFTTFITNVPDHIVNLKTMSPSATRLTGEELINKAMTFRSVKRYLSKQSPSHQHQVARTLFNFQQQTGMTPDDLVAYAKTHDETDTDDLLRSETKKMSLHQPQQEQNYYQLRGHLSRNGKRMPKTDLEYIPKQHPEYKKEDLRKLLNYLQNKVHKLYVLITTESGLRAQTVLNLRIRHIQDDLTNNRTPIAVRLEAQYYRGKKPAGKTFLGPEAITMLRDCQANNLIGTQPDDRLIPLAYPTINQVLQRAKKNANLDKAIQPSHGMRKYFENALDKAGIDHEIKMRIEGHTTNTRPKAYTTNDFDELRQSYLKAYPHISIYDPTDTKTAETLQQTNTEINTLKDRIAKLEEMLIDKTLETITPALDTDRILAKLKPGEQYRDKDRIVHRLSEQDWKNIGDTEPPPNPLASLTPEELRNLIKQLVQKELNNQSTQTSNLPKKNKS